MNCFTNDSTPKVTIKGDVVDRRDRDKERREIRIDKTESRKLPLKDYPVTHKTCPEGLETMVISGQTRCQASFHRYTEKTRGGEGAYIGSATRRLDNDRSQSEVFRNFLQEVGVFTPGTEVNLDLEKCGDVIRVYLSRLPPAKARSSPLLTRP